MRKAPPIRVWRGRQLRASDPSLPACSQLRYLQTLSTISAEKNSTIIFPLPIDVLSHFLDK